MEALWQDLLYGFRMLFKAPGFTLPAVCLAGAVAYAVTERKREMGIRAIRIVLMTSGPGRQERLTGGQARVIPHLASHG